MTKKNRNPENAVVYARYSSHNQQETSIEGQLAAAKQYAEKHGYTIIKEYCDRAKTGTNDNREAFQQMLSDTAKRQFTVIIVWKVDRFGRNREEIAFNKYRCKKNGVRVEYVAENVPEGPEGVILESVLEGMAEYYSLQLSQNIRRGHLEAAKKHRVISGAHLAFGYKMGPDKTYEVNPAEAPAVKQIFNMYADGKTEFEIIRYLNESGFRTKRGGEFKKNSVVAILKNEKYIGTYAFKDIIYDEDAIPAIVDKETFRKVQEMLKMNKRMPSHKWSYSDYLLTGKMFCGKCGAPMAGVSGKGRSGEKHSYYCCMKRWKEKSCDKKNIRQDVVEPLVMETISGILDDSELLKFITDKTWDLYQKQDTEQVEMRALEADLASVEKGLSNLVKSIEAGLFNDMIQNRMNELEGQRAALKKAIAERGLMRKFKLTREFVQFSLEKFRDMDRTDRECQRRLVETFVNSIFLYDDKITLTFNYSSDRNTVTLTDIEKACPSDTTEVFERACSSGANPAAFEPLSIYWILNVFAVDRKISASH